MDEQRPVESILAADVGSVLTHVCLIDQVDGVYRFVAQAEAPTTLWGPENDLIIGLRRAIQRVEHIVQRPLLDVHGELIVPEQASGAGVDAFVATSNAALPLQCAIIGLTDALSLESAQHACAAAPVSVVRTISLGKRARRWDERALLALHQSPPEVIVMVGGVDTGPVAPMESAARVLVTLYEDVEAERRPIIVFAGNQEARRPVSAIVSPLFDLRVVDNVRPDMHTESLGELQRELTDIYERIKLAQLPGYRRLRQWCAAPVLSTMEAFSRVLRFVARRDRLPQGVLGVDVGGASTYVGVVHNEVYQWVLAGELGVSHGIRPTLALSGVQNVERWLPVAISEDEIVNRLENARLRPQSVAQTMEDLFLVQAVLRQDVLLAMRQMRRQYWQQLPGGDASASPQEITPAFDLILARGGAIVHAPKDGIALLSLLDAVQPVGLARVVIDWASIWPQLGALAESVPLAAAQVLERDSFRDLGTVIAPIGEAPDGELALRLRIIRSDNQVTEAVIPAGTIRRFPLAADEQATVEVRPSAQFDIGLNRKGRGGRTQIFGGGLGIIVDTRGRPLSLPRDAHYRRTKLQEWLGNLISDANGSS